MRRVPAIAASIVISALVGTFALGCASSSTTGSAQSSAQDASAASSSAQEGSSSAESAPESSAAVSAGIKTDARGFKNNNTNIVDDIDFTEDGNLDVVTVEAAPGNKGDHDYGTYYVTMNGQKVLEEDYVLGINIDSFITEDGDRFLFVHPYTDNSDGPNVIYEYYDGEFTPVMYCDDIMRGVEGNHSYVNDIEVDGNTVYVGTNFMSIGTGGIGGFFPFEYKDGKFEQLSYIGKWNPFFSDGEKVVYHANKTIQAYSGPECTEPSFQIGKGDALDVTELYVKGSKCSMHVVTSSGNDGWIRVPQELPDDYMPLLEELFYAG